MNTTTLLTATFDDAFAACRLLDEEDLWFDNFDVVKIRVKTADLAAVEELLGALIVTDARKAYARHFGRPANIDAVWLERDLQAGRA